MCASFFFKKMKASKESALGIHNAPSNGPAVVPTPSQGPEQVQKVIYFKNITCTLTDS